MDGRRYTLILIVLIVASIYVIRIFSLQVVSSYWSDRGTALTEKEVVVYPSRGVIYDRNLKVLVTSQTVYDLMVLPKDVVPFDTAKFCDITNLTLKELKAILKKAVTYPNVKYKPSPVIKQMKPEEYAPIAGELYQFKGFYAQARTLRVYPEKAGALLLGDVGEVTKALMEKYPEYKKGDYIGLSGIEKAYENELRGQRGIKYVFRDNLGVERQVANGTLDIKAIEGTHVVSSIDAELQKYGEKLLQNKRGCVVAIEPNTGEILAMVSSPTFDPNLLLGRARGKNFLALSRDKQKPLFNRVTQAQYRPGSIFKIAQSLTALQLGAITKETRIVCNRGIIGCHGSHSNDDLEMAIVHSCNPYFRGVLQRVVEAGRVKGSRNKDAHVGLGIWREQMMKFGFGTNLNTDIPGVKKGMVPSPEYYDRAYGKESWNFSTIYSISIGEGEMLVTPIQMCNLACIVANKGFYYSPHTVRSVGIGGKARPEFLEKHDVGVNAEYFDVVISAMEKVVGPGGTANGAKLQDIVICGKTGTVQNEPRKDHSVFVCFAPKENPKIALAVYVENCGFGGTWAAPIASLMIEQYLNGEVKNLDREKHILEQNFLNQ